MGKKSQEALSHSRETLALEGAGNCQIKFILEPFPRHKDLNTGPATSCFISADSKVHHHFLPRFLGKSKTKQNVVYLTNIEIISLMRRTSLRGIQTVFEWAGKRRADKMRQRNQVQPDSKMRGEGVVKNHPLSPSGIEL